MAQSGGVESPAMIVARPRFLRVSRARPARQWIALILIGVLSLPAAGAAQPAFPEDFQVDRRSRSERQQRSSDDTMVIRRLPIYYPPNPPPLGAEIIVPASDPRRNGVPEELADYVNDPFYAPLSTRLVEHLITPQQQSLLDEYTELKNALTEELHARLYNLTNLGPADRRRALEQLAVAQQEGLARLEKLGETLRNDLIDRDFFASTNISWEWMRQWKLGRGRLDRPREQNIVLEHQVMRAAVFYYQGLSPAQRRLLREIVMELEERAYGKRGKPGFDSGWFFFLPEGARIRLPDDLPPPLPALVAEFREKKSALKKELNDVVYEQDGARMKSSRTRALEELAARQAPRMAALERLADDIRVALAAINQPPRRATPQLIAPELYEAIQDILRESTALFRLRERYILQARREQAAPASTASPEALKEWQQQQVEREAAAVERFGEENAERLEIFQARLDALREDLVKFAGERAILGTGELSTAFVGDFVQRRTMEESVFEFETAVYEPGLSPEQRRLLFSSALERLQLPLPGPEPQAGPLPETILPRES